MEALEADTDGDRREPTTHGTLATSTLAEMVQRTPEVKSLVGRSKPARSISKATRSAGNSPAYEGCCGCIASMRVFDSVAGQPGLDAVPSG